MCPGPAFMTTRTGPSLQSKKGWGRSGPHHGRPSRLHRQTELRGPLHSPLRSGKTESQLAHATRTPHARDPHLCVCTMLGAEASSSSAEQGVSGGAPRFTRANTFTVGGSQLDGLLEERTQGRRGRRLQKETPGAQALEGERSRGAERAVKRVRTRSWDTGASGVTREVASKV